MDVNGINSVLANTYTANQKSGKTSQTANNSSAAEELGVVYEPSTGATDSTSSQKTDYSSIVASLKKEQAAHTQQLQNLVDQLISKQGHKYTTLAEIFENAEVDEETRAEAQKEIGEDGYWGVEQTSDRLVAMAQALSGGDPSKADTLIDAIKEGFSQAGQAWGGDLPEICQKTVDSAIQKLEKWRDGVTDSQEQA